MLLYFCARTKEFIPGREPPSEVVNREAEKKPKEPKPSGLKGPVSPLLCEEYSDKAGDRLNTPGTSARLEAPQR